MRNLEIKLNGVSSMNPVVLVDDKRVKLKKNSFGNLIANIETEKETANIKVYKYLQINSKLWFLTEIFFFIISLFGVLDYKKDADRNCTVLEADLDVAVKEQSTLNLVFNSAKKDGKAFEIESSSEVKENSNISYVDNVAKKRKKILKFMKIGVALAVAVFVVFVLI